MTGKPFRSSAAFGKRIEFYVVGLMLRAGLDVYLPLVDDDAIDAVVKRRDGSFVEVQIKARSNGAKFGNGALFAALTHELRANYWFVFYSERMETMWILSSAEFIQESRQNMSGKNKGKRTLQFAGKNSKTNKEHVFERYKKYVTTDFRRIVEGVPDEPIQGQA
jgi:hypothetical protein